jgi:hypothetical protein
LGNSPDISETRRRVPGCVGYNIWNLYDLRSGTLGVVEDKDERRTIRQTYIRNYQTRRSARGQHREDHRSHYRGRLSDSRDETIAEFRLSAQRYETPLIYEKGAFI